MLRIDLGTNDYSVNYFDSDGVNVLCQKKVHELFELPDTITKITLVLSNRRSRESIEVSVPYREGHVYTKLLDYNEPVWITGALRRILDSWFDDNKRCFARIEYES